MSSKNLKARVAALEKYLKQRNPGVGVIHPLADGAWELHFNGKKHIFTSEGAARAAFYARAPADATLILWG